MSAPAVSAVRGTSYRTTPSARPITIALLGFGRIGAAVAGGARTSPHPLRIVGALVRDASAARAAQAGIDLTTDPDRLFACRPDVIVEVLGGLEPARTLVAAALARRIPVVTANKALIAHHGHELFDLSARTRTALRYEASVLAGVPFLGTFAARPLAARVSKLTGILNGTSNFILSRVRDSGASISAATSEAQHLGFAEPDPSDDLTGRDAAHKLAVLAWHFGFGVIGTETIESTGIAAVTAGDIAAAKQLGGTIKPIASVERSDERTSAFVGPTFVPAGHPLAAIDGANNALILDTEAGRLAFGGPGAGPLPTSTTILDDVFEAVRGGRPRTFPRRGTTPAVAPPNSGWLLRLDGDRLPRDYQFAEVLGGHGIWSRRSVCADRGRWLLTHPCSRERVEAALRAISASTPCDAQAIRALEH